MGKASRGPYDPDLLNNNSRWTATARLRYSRDVVARLQQRINGAGSLPTKDCSPLLEPMVREPIVFLTQQLLEKCCEQSLDLSSRRRKRAFHDFCFRRAAFRRSISRSAKQH